MHRSEPFSVVQSEAAVLCEHDNADGIPCNRDEHCPADREEWDYPDKER